MIPKIIHYCWFGGNPLPKSVKKCIESWKKYFPGYEIKEWNESNFDVNLIPYTQEAYKAKKYAFVSDVARFWILYNEGGLYFDTDVEVIKSFDDVIAKGTFMGFETPEGGVNPGLGLGAEKDNPLFAEVIDYYKTLHFCNEEGVQNPGTVVAHTTHVLENHGLKRENKIQELDGLVTIYPQDWFNPFDDLTGVLEKTTNTHSIHWFSKTWLEKPMIYFRITRILHRLLGPQFFHRK